MPLLVDQISSLTRVSLMAISKSVIAFIYIMISLIILLQVVHSDEMTMSSTGRSLLQKIDCGAKCAERCKLSGRPNLCHRACGTCCGRCNCVPPGTYGNYEVCPCYANITTTGGKKKCP